jgi:hypothetical protein
LSADAPRYFKSGDRGLASSARENQPAITLNDAAPFTRRSGIREPSGFMIGQLKKGCGSPKLCATHLSGSCNIVTFRSDSKPVQSLTLSDVVDWKGSQATWHFGEGQDFRLIDVRKPEAWDQSDTMLPEAICIPLDDWEQHLSRIPVSRPVVTYCT